MATPVLPAWKRRLLVYAPALVVVLFAAALLLTYEQRRRSTAAVQGTYELIASVQQLRRRLVDAETGQRGYLITNDTAYLAPYRDAGADVQALLLGLERAGTDPAQAQLLAEIGRSVRDRLAIMALPIQQRSVSFEAARDQLIAGRGREAMERLRVLILEFESRELARLEQQLERQRLAGVLVTLAMLLGTLMVLVVSAVTRRQFRGYERSLEVSNTQLTEANHLLQDQAMELELQSQELQVQTMDLEEKTAELQAKTEALEATNDELRRQRQQLEDQAVELETTNDDLQAAYLLAEQNREAAEEANQTKTRFLTSMSHELRTPLNAIAGYVDLLQLGVHGQLTDQQRSALQRIKHNGNHLLVLINDILDYAKLQVGRVELRRHEVALGELIGETELLVRPLLQAKCISFQGPEDAAVSVRGDPDRIRQILLNLLSNAAKYTDAGGAVAISTEADAHCVRIHVRDTGWGIPPEMLASIFDPFVQVNRGANGSLTDGVGLGLSISKELAIAMDGDLSVDSSPGRGSTFTLTLARGESSPQLAPESPTMPA